MKRNGSLEISNGCHNNGYSSLPMETVGDNDINDAYRKYVQSLLTLEREQHYSNEKDCNFNGNHYSNHQQQQQSSSSVKKLVAQAGGFIGHLMKTKSANGHLNKLNESTANVLTNISANQVEEFNGDCDAMCSPNKSFLHNGHDQHENEEGEKNGWDEPVVERPTTRAFERERRQAVREQTVRTKTLKQWNLHDVTRGGSDFLEPRQRLESLRSLTSNGRCATDATSFAKEYTCSKEDYTYRKRQQQQRQPSISAKEAVSHESIANISQTRQRWQQMVDDNQQGRNCRSTTPSMMTCPSSAHQHQKPAPGHYSNRSTPIIMNGNTYHHHIGNEGNGLGGTSGRLGHSSQSLNVSNLDSPTTTIDFRRHNGNANSPAPGSSISNHVTNSTIVDQRGVPLDVYEKERMLLVAYIQGHPEVVASLGITVPFHIRQKFPAVSQLKVELREVTPQLNGNNGYSYQQQPEHNGYAGQNGSRFSPESNGNNSLPKYGRYIKNPQPPIVVANAQRKIVRKQSSVETTNANNNNAADVAPAGGKRPNGNGWKLAEWSEPPPAVNNGAAGNMQIIGSPVSADNDRPGSYRSAGESLIAREIRELREREEELRRSRSELGLANLEDIVDSWKLGQKQQHANGGGMRAARSLDHLHILVEQNGHSNSQQRRNDGRNVADAYDDVSNKLFTRSGSMDHLHFVSNNNNGNVGPTVAAQNLHNHATGIDGRAGIVIKSSSPKGAYERFLSSHSASNGGADMNNGYHSNGKILANQNELQYSSRKRDFASIEARIEKELEDIRQREEELRRQREAAGFAPQTNANFTTETLEDSSTITTIREYDNQKNLNFKPVYGAPYELHKMDDPDEMLLAPGDGTNGTNGHVMDNEWINIGDNRLKF